MKAFFIISSIWLLLTTGCGLPEQFLRVPEDSERRNKDSAFFCAKPPCIALVTHSTLDVPYLDATSNNHLRYAKKFKLDRHSRNNLISTKFTNEFAASKVFQLGLYWQKLIAVRDLLNLKENNKYRYEWVWWLDADALFTNFSKSPQNFIKKFGAGKDIIIAKDPFSALNAGVFLVRNTQFSRDFIDDIINLFPYYKNAKLPEQTAMQDYVLGFVTKNPHGDFVFTPEESRNYNNIPIPKVKLVKQRELNAFYKGGYGAIARGPDIIWEPGDFIVHFAVSEDKNKSIRALLDCFKKQCGPNYENNSSCLKLCK